MCSLAFITESYTVHTLVDFLRRKTYISKIMDGQISSLSKLKVTVQAHISTNDLTQDQINVNDL